MSYEDWRRASWQQWELDGVEESIDQPLRSPGKRTLTMSLPPRSASALASAQAPVQQKADPAAVVQRKEQAALTEQWMDVALRPDLHDAPVQRKSSGDEERDQASTFLPTNGAGQAMPEAVQAKMEGAFGADFSAVRIHEGPQATAMGALAYTQGTDIHFAPGQYRPSSQSGQALLGHELAHVVQQSQGRVSATTQAKGAGVNDDADLEREADELGAKAARGEQVRGSEAPSADAKGKSTASAVQTNAVQLKDEDEKDSGSKQPEQDAHDVNVFAGGARLGHGAPPPLPAGVPPPSMSSRHVLTNFNFFKAVKPGPGAGNSYLLQPINQGTLELLYREAVASGIKDGPVKLSNGQLWYVNQTTGKFFPMAGPKIIELTQQEVRLLEMLVKQIRSGKTMPEQALQNLSRAMHGQSYTISHAMEKALEVTGQKLGFSKKLITAKLAAHAPASRTMTNVPEDLRQAAHAKAGGKPFRLLKWGGRILLVVAVAADLYEVYEAENKAKIITKKVGAWGASLAAGGAAAEAASPLLGGGPWGWVGYGAAVFGAGGLGYLLGGEITETVYEWGFE